jgi:hypothetical protein
VENLEDERKQLQYTALNAAFRAVLELAPSTAVSSAKLKKIVVTAVRFFLTALAMQTEVRVNKQDAALAELPASLDLFVTLATLKPSAKPAAKLSTALTARLSSVVSRRLLMAWLLLKGRDVPLDFYGLDYNLKRTGDAEAEYENHTAVVLLQAFLDYAGWENMAGGHSIIERAFTSAACCTFMQVHESGGVEWFNKERYEELLEWFSLCALLVDSASKPAPRTITARLGVLAAENRRMNELATRAGYRTKLLLKLLEPVATLPTISSPAAAPKKTARKKADVQSSPRTHTPKAPDHKVPR